MVHNLTLERYANNFSKEFPCFPAVEPVFPLDSGVSDGKVGVESSHLIMRSCLDA